MTELEAVRLLAWLLVLAPIANIYFVWHGWHIYRSDPGRSAILLGLFVIKTTIWVIGVLIGIYSLRFILGQPPLPFNGVTLVLALIVINLLPAYIHFAVIRKYERP